MHWRIDESLAHAPEIEHRNRFARTIADRPVDELIATFGRPLPEVRFLLGIVAERLGPGWRAGACLELGAGTGSLACLVAEGADDVSVVYAVEVVPEVVHLLMPQVLEHVLPGDRRVVPVLGSFDDLELPDASIDLVIEHDSLHHSNDLDVTLAETARVLRRGGRLVCFDRSHPDSISDAEIEALLAQRYSRDHLRSRGLPEDLVLTRRENGEHEIREREWRAAFDRHGLELTDLVHVRRRRELGPSVRRALRERDPSPVKSCLGQLRWKRQPDHVVGPARDVTVMLCRRRADGAGTPS